MKARILRGADQVGGSLVEVEHEGDRLVLDVGMPLETVPFRDLLPDVAGLWSAGDGSLKGVFITHGHPDHYGLADLVHRSVPIYMGWPAKAILDAAAFFTGKRTGFGCSGILENEIPIKAGRFTITPHLVDHSGFDAYGLLVEAGRDSLFYTGDVRFHGRKSERMRSLPSRLPSDLGCLLMEGTNFDRPARTDGLSSEQDLEQHLARSFRRLEGTAICFYSAQNIDRLVTLFRAAKRSGRTFVLDLYGATIAAATNNRNIPQPGWGDVRVYVRGIERRQVLRTKEFERIDRVKATRIFQEELAANPSGFVITARSRSIAELAKAGALEGATAFWSQWAGYIERDQMLTRRLNQHGIETQIAHVSGHATAQDLVEFAERVRAGKTLAIHTNSSGFLRDRITSHRMSVDGEWWNVASEN